MQQSASTTLPICKHAYSFILLCLPTFAPMPVLTMPIPRHNHTKKTLSSGTQKKKLFNPPYHRHPPPTFFSLFYFLLPRSTSPSAPIYPSPSHIPFTSHPPSSISFLDLATFVSSTISPHLTPSHAHHIHRRNRTHHRITPANRTPVHSRLFSSQRPFYSLLPSFSLSLPRENSLPTVYVRLRNCP